jgi:uncharacterized membrane protein
MVPSIIRTLVSLVIAAVMVYQLRSTPSQSYKRRAFGTAAAAFGLLGIFNIKVTLDPTTGPWTLAILFVIFVLLLVSVLLLVVAWRKGEMKPQIERARQAIEEERARRETVEKDKTERK